MVVGCLSAFYWRIFLSLARTVGLKLDGYC